VAAAGLLLVVQRQAVGSSGEAVGLDLDPHGPRGSLSSCTLLVPACGNYGLWLCLHHLGGGAGHSDGGLLLPPEVDREIWWISRSHVLPNNWSGGGPSGLHAKSPICLRSVLLYLAIGEFQASPSEEKQRVALLGHLDWIAVGRVHPQNRPNKLHGGITKFFLLSTPWDMYGPRFPRN
jgi:hypothetical protein